MDRKLSIMLSALLLLVARNVLATEYSRAHSASDGIVINGYGTVPIYKFTDSEGRVSYSTSASADFIHAEEVAIISPPSPRRLASSTSRFEKMKAAVVQFDAARDERRAIREKNEIKRLQRLALINQVKPPVITREFIYPAYPYRLRKKHGSHFDISRHHSSRRSPGADLSLPPSSFRAGFHR